MNTPGKYTEVELVSLLKDRDNQAFSYLYDNYSAALYGVISPIVNDAELANDVLQEVFINIWRKIETYDPTKGRLFTWMLNIARNASIDLLRSKSYQNSQKNQSLMDTVNWNSSLQTQQTDTIGLYKLLEKLKEEQRVLVDLAYFKGYTHEEIAEIEGIPLGTVKTRIRNALIQLRNIMK
ncbi:MAG TPA: sigma-70 family RNA polymerase sigma factor [Chitinophagaceae bacterium]|nr:sigma-70 family RNA polymerase sigma factor [Chitinophagaceae bacterium]